MTCSVMTEQLADQHVWDGTTGTNHSDIVSAYPEVPARNRMSLITF